jgi:uncharacterized Zn finger protein
MAYARNIERSCTNCGRKATYEVLNSRNASYGYYCKNCATGKVKQLELAEQQGKEG